MSDIEELDRIARSVRLQISSLTFHCLLPKLKEGGSKFEFDLVYTVDSDLIQYVKDLREKFTTVREIINTYSKDSLDFWVDKCDSFLENTSHTACRKSHLYTFFDIFDVRTIRLNRTLFSSLNIIPNLGNINPNKIFDFSEELYKSALSTGFEIKNDFCMSKYYTVNRKITGTYNTVYGELISFNKTVINPEEIDLIKKFIHTCKLYVGELFRGTENLSYNLYTFFSKDQFGAESSITLYKEIAKNLVKQGYLKNI